MTISPPALAAWPRIWELPGIWIKICANEPITSRDAAEALLEAQAMPMRAAAIWDQLLSRGEFWAAERLCEHNVFLDALEPTRRETLVQELNEAREATKEKIRVACEELRAQEKRLPIERGKYTSKLDTAPQDVAHRAIEAERLIASVRESLRHEEDRISATLRVKMPELLAQSDLESPRIAEWRSAAEKALDAREFEVARFLIDQGPQGFAEHDLVTEGYRLPFPFVEAPATICDWFLGQGRGPRGFHEHWGADGHDHAAFRLVRALQGWFKTLEYELDLAMIQEVGWALERFLECPDIGYAPKAQKVAGGWCVWVRGLFAPEMPALAPALHSSPRGVPLVLPLDTEIDELAEPSDGSLELLLVQPGKAYSASGYVRVETNLLFLLVRNRAYRKQQFLRAIGGMIPYRLAYPDNIPPCIELLYHRDDELNAILNADGPCLLVGPGGMGKSMLLRAITDKMRHVCTPLYLRCATLCPPGTSTFESLLAFAKQLQIFHPDRQPPDIIAPRREWLAANKGKRGVVVLDDADDWVRQCARDGCLDLLVDMLRFLHHMDIHVVLGGRPALLRAQEIQQTLEGPLTIVLLAPYHPGVTREYITTFARYLGLSFARPGLVDRLVYYAGGIPTLLSALLRGLIRHLGTRSVKRRNRIEENDIEVARQSAEFRQVCQTIALDPIASRPDLRIVLGLILELTAPDAPTIDASLLEEWGSTYGLMFDKPDALGRMLQDLADSGLITQTGSEVQVASSGIGPFLADAISEPMKYVEKASGELREIPV